jgi:hypothetical protein
VLVDNSTLIVRTCEKNLARKSRCKSREGLMRFKFTPQSVEKLQVVTYTYTETPLIPT